MDIKLESGSDRLVDEFAAAGLVIRSAANLSVTKHGRDVLRNKTEKTILDCPKWLTDHPSNDIIY
jgi:hypothetical protein